MSADFADARSWPFEEARKVAERVRVSGKGTALFETGYGPSGLPHIGTFGEVARTTWVRRAFEKLTGQPTRLIAFSDDMDGLRKVPDNVPNREMLLQFLGRPVTAVPDPFGTHESFGHHNNARLRAFLDRFGFEYEFASSSDYYRSGAFDAALLRMAERHEDVRAVILPTLGPERRATYSPFLPIHPKTGVVMQVPMQEVRAAEDLLVWLDPETGERHGTRITGGHCKAQWKADWALRWFALGVDYEMSGKDLIDSVKLSGRICQVLGGQPPIGYTYELFLDEEGGKISKSKGNGLTIDEWLHYAPPESLSQFMFNQPGRAKRLHFDVIPRAVDEYLSNLSRYGAFDRNFLDPDNPAWHIHGGQPVKNSDSPVPFGMLLNLVVVLGTDDEDVLIGYLGKYVEGMADSPEKKRKFAENLRNPESLIRRFIRGAANYGRDFVIPRKVYRSPTAEEKAGLEFLASSLRSRLEELQSLPTTERSEEIQNLVYDAGRREPFVVAAKDGRLGVSRAWFNALYQVLLGQAEGPRFGSFVALYGIAGTIGLIEGALDRPQA